MALALCTACSGQSQPPPPYQPAAGGQSGAGSAGSSSAGASGAAGAAVAGGAAGAAGTGGLSGSAGSAGAAGAAGSAGAGGGMPGCEQLGTPGNTGIQCDPGIDGNGTFDQEDPMGDATPPEAEADPAGELTQSANFESTVYGYGFSYRIYAPTQYQAGKPAALMVFQDGGNYTGNFRVPSVIDSLVASGEMPVTIAVFIEPGNDRSQEYDTRDDKYGTMLIDELLPGAVLNNYDIVDDPNGWAIGGHSSGGACAFNAGWFFPDKFRKIMTHSASFIGLSNPTIADYIDMVLVEPKQPLRVNLLSGENDLECCGDTWFNANNNMAMNLETAGYAYRYMKSTTTHDPRPWATSDFPDAMRWLWKGYTLPHYAAP